MFGSLKKEKLKPKLRCFEREIDELVKEETEIYGNKFENVPIIIFLSVKVLEKQKFKEGIFRISGNLTVVKKLQEKFDNPFLIVEDATLELEKIGKHVEGQFAIATLIKKYLLTLPDPLIPFSLYDKFMDAILTRQEKMRVELLKKVSKEISVASLESNVNQMHPDNIGTAVGPSILRAGSMNTSKGLADIKFVSLFLATMTKHWPCIFNDEEYKEEKKPDEITIIENQDSSPNSPDTPSKKSKPPLPKRNNNLKGESPNNEEIKIEKGESPKIPPKSTIDKLPPKLEPKESSQNKPPKAPSKINDTKSKPTDTNQEQSKEISKKPSLPILPTKSPIIEIKSPKVPPKMKDTNTPQLEKSPLDKPIPDSKQEKPLPPKPKAYSLEFNEKNFKDVCMENERLIKEIIDLKTENIELKIQIDGLRNELFKQNNKQPPVNLKEENMKNNFKKLVSNGDEAIKKLVSNVMNTNNNVEVVEEEFQYD